MIVAVPPVAVEAPPAVVAEDPRILTPGAYQVSFGRVLIRLPRDAARVVVLVDGRRAAGKAARGGSLVSVQVPLPSRDVGIRAVAIARDGARRASRVVRPVYGLPAKAAARPTAPHEDELLADAVRRLARSFRGTAAVYVEDLQSGEGAAWNARARFPAASTLKLAIAVEVMRMLRGPPAPDSRVARLLRAMIVHSDNDAANELETLVGGSTSGGAARVNATMRALGLADSEMYGGYALQATGGPRPIPLRIESQPAYGIGKRTTAVDLARLARAVHLAASGRGPVSRRLHGTVRPEEARHLLYLLVHAADPGKLDRFLGGLASVAHKSGWIASARHDSGLVYWRGGAFVVSVLTWNAGGVGVTSDILAGRVAKVALERFQRSTISSPSGFARRAKARAKEPVPRPLGWFS